VTNHQHQQHSRHAVTIKAHLNDNTETRRGLKIHRRSQECRVLDALLHQAQPSGRLPDPVKKPSATWTAMTTFWLFVCLDHCNTFTISCNNCHNATALLVIYLFLVPRVLAGLMSDILLVYTATFVLLPLFLLPSSGFHSTATLAGLVMVNISMCPINLLLLGATVYHNASWPDLVISSLLLMWSCHDVPIIPLKLLIYSVSPSACLKHIVLLI